jgi:hypothetical protein
MMTSQLELCLDIPPDHRLRALCRLARPTALSSRGTHTQSIRALGDKVAQDYRPIDADEVGFAEWLAQPHTQGGVVIALQQPSKSQVYSSNYEQVKNECATLRYLDEALKMLIGSSLAETSCFDAYPFDPTPMEEVTPLKQYGHQVFLQMIADKKPSVVLCAWKPPSHEVEPFFASTGVGTENEPKEVINGDHRILSVNAFHPSYAINYHINESCFRQLFMLELIKAFAVANATWIEEPWMHQLRQFCQDRARILNKGKYNFQLPS